MRELWERFQGAGSSPEQADKYFQAQDFTDLQVLSQIAWFDEFFLAEPEIAGLVRKGRDFSLEDQKFVIDCQRELIKKVLPEHARRRNKGKLRFRLRLSTIPFCR